MGILDKLTGKKPSQVPEPVFRVELVGPGGRPTGPSRLRRGTRPPPPEPLTADLVDLRGMRYGRLSVVGESHRQPALMHVAGGCTEDGPARTDQEAVLLREPNNPEDPDAIKVSIRTAEGLYHVGYIAIAGPLGGNDNLNWPHFGRE